MCSMRRAESYLAVPYAFSKLNANAQSAEYYGNCRGSHTENGRLDAAIERIRTAICSLGVGERDGRAPGMFWQLKNVPDAPSRVTFMPCWRTHFQEGLKNYSDLAYMGRLLGGGATAWQPSPDMIDTRESAYAERLPRADALLSSVRGEAAAAPPRGRKPVKRIEKEQDVAALRLPEETAQWGAYSASRRCLRARPIRRLAPS